jgi:hypothetical protein
MSLPTLGSLGVDVESSKLRLTTLHKRLWPGDTTEFHVPWYPRWDISDRTTEGRRSLLIALITPNNGTSGRTNWGSGTTIDRGRFLCRLEGDGGVEYGWVPRTAQAGDLFCVLAGAPFPYVIRRNDEGTFKLLGNAWSSEVTLKQTLGGAGSEVRNKDFHFPVPHDNYKREDFMVWGSEEQNKAPGREEMRSLIEGLGWITLK